MKQLGSIKTASIIVLILTLFIILLEWTGPHVHYSIERDCLVVQQDDTFNCYGNPAVYAIEENLGLEAAQESWNAYVSEARKKNELRQRVNLDTSKVILMP